jgi:PAS domain S-box-containing protein
MPGSEESQRLRAEIRALHQELEQARVSAEDGALHVQSAVNEADALRDELRRANQSHRSAERSVNELRDRLAAVVGDREAERATQGAAQEELQIVVEELEVLAEELQQSNEQLRAVNAELDTRVAERTRELRDANSALRERESRLSLTMRHAGACSWDWETATGRVHWSAEAAELYGSQAMVSMADWLSMVLPEDRAALQTALQQCAAQRRAEVEVEYRIRHPQKGLRWLSSRGRLTGDEAQGQQSVSGLSTDISELKAAENLLQRSNEELTRRVREAVAAHDLAREQLFQKQKLEALGQLTGGVAHDFNNLLAVIGNALHLSLIVPEADERRRLIERMQTAVSRGASLTRRLLAFGRRQALKPERLDLRSSIAELLELVRPSLRSDTVISGSVEPGTHMVWLDSGELQLAIINLCINARDAMPAGGRIEIQARNHKGGDKPHGAPANVDFVEISVADNGMGMSAEVLGHVFEPFFTTKDIGDGTGLGLAQVHGFVNQSGGTVYAASKPGEGTRITMLLPCAPGQMTQAVVADADSARAAMASILMVEDDEDLGPLVEQMLQGRFRVLRTHNAQSALELVQRSSEKFDLVFTDIRLPAGMNGLQLAQRLRKHRPQLPVVVTTGYGGPLVAEAISAGLPVLRKPYQYEELESMLMQALDSRIV